VHDDARTKSRWRWLGHKLAQHAHWARDQGLRRLIEEDQLNPVRRGILAAAKWRWRRSHSIAPTAIPVFVVGVQRSGTNMVVRGLEAAPEVEVYNENSRVAFDRFRLRPNVVIRTLVEKSGHRYVLFKPLCDSHRTPELLDALGTPSPGRAVWIYRSVDGRVRSALAKFGANNLRVLREIAAGRGDHLWQAQGLSEESLDVIRSFDYTAMTAESAAALFWYVRNALYFELDLHERSDVMLVSYDGLVSGPERDMRSLCSFLDFPYDPQLVSHVAPREAPLRGRLAVDPVIREHCERLEARLGASARAKRADQEALAAGGG
jgi:hypothetical protein